MKQLFYSIFFIAIALTSISVYAQDDQPLVADINYGMSVEDTISERAFFDWWKLDVEVGDEIVVSMQADGGLQPLLGLLDEGGNLLTRSDLETVAEVNGVAFLEYTALTAGQYTIIASRDGRDQGTTTGPYLLTVTNRNDEQPSRPNPFLETEFRCNEWLLTNALTFRFTEDFLPPDNIQSGQITESYRISVYGLDGFEPVIRILSDVLQDRPLDCTDSAQATVGTQLDLPVLDTPYTVTSDDTDNVAMVTLNNYSDSDALGDIFVSIGAKENTSGRFIVVLEGMKLHERTDSDEFFVRRGAFASDSTLDIYMIGYPDTRLDSLLETLDQETDVYQVCDDIGRDDCADLSSIASSTIVIGEGEATYTADRFDAGLRIDSPDNTRIVVTFRSRELNTAGEYLVVFVGELPPRE